MHEARLGIKGAAEFEVILLYKLIREQPLPLVAALSTVALLLYEGVTIDRFVTRNGFARFVLQLKLLIKTLSILLVLILSLRVERNLLHTLIYWVTHVVAGFIELTNR